MASHDESFSTSTELALMFGNFFGVAEAENLSLDTDSSGTATEKFDQTPQANIVSGRQTGLELTDNGTPQAESTTTPNLLAAQTPTSTINVNYNGFSTEAQAAFEYAVDIWESLIVSPVPIEIEADWTPLGKDTNILGSARSNDYYYNFANAAYANTSYPSALANSLAGFDLDTTAHDINVNFNSNYSNWYFDTDGNTPTGKTDFVSVVLHELGHGLGFSGSMNYDSNTKQGSWWSQPKIYDHFTVNGSGQKLIDTFPNNSVALGAQLISDNLFFNGSNAVAANGGTNPKLYAPSIWELGSSYAHLDEATYGSGSSNALMTPQITPGEANHHPGAVTLGIFEDLGWIINFQPQADLWGWDFNVTPEPLNAGDSFDIDFDIINTGSSAGAFDVSFYLSSNNTISTVDHFLGSTTINGLAGNSMDSFTKSLNLPGVNHSVWNGDGTYYIGMLVDSGADVTETNETNNSNFGFLFDYDDVAINNTQLADLSGWDFDVTPEPLDAGDSFDIDFDITNTGGSAGAFDVSFYLSSNDLITTVDHFLGSTTINGLAGNSTGSFTKSLNLPGVNHSFWDLYGDDTYYIGMRVDSGSDVTETNETNNSNVGFLFDYDDVAINNTQMADLSGWDFDVTPEPLDAGDSFDIDFDITNTGGSAGAFDVSFYLSSNDLITTVDHFLGSTTINGLAGNSTDFFTTSLNLPGVNHSFWDLYGDDTYYIGMRVDSGSDVTETNETNNSNVGFLFDYDDVAINNTQIANLSGLNFNVTPEPLNAGDSFDIDLTIENSGAAAAGVFDVSLYLSSDSSISNSDLLLDTISFIGLAANSSGTFTSNFILPEANDAFWSGDGSYHIGMMIDSGDDITETIETDNANVGLMLDTDNVVINNTQLADLVGVDFNLVQEPLAAGDHFDVNFEVQNMEMFAAGAFDVSFYVSTDNNIDTADQFLGSTTINGLAGNSIGAYTTGLTLPGINDSTWNGDGIYYIGMIIDQDGTLPETDETNNSNNGLFVDYDNVLISDTELIGTDDDDTLFGTPGDDILSGLRDDDDLVGGGGDDTLFGDRGDDNLFGEAGSDMLFGDRGDDYLFGGTGNDTLFGDRGDDLLIGVELNLANPGLGEVDSLIGGFGADVFQLGDVFTAYYDDADGTTDGSTDYALITDFDINQDIIELHGSVADYQLATVSPSLPSGIGVFLQSSTPSGQDELIGIVQGESSLSLNDSYFSFV